MLFAERWGREPAPRADFVRLRKRVHEQMEREHEARLREHPQPSEEEIYMAAFREWLEPQVRDAARAMFEKGYATQSSGFNADYPELQSIDGLFAIDEATEQSLKAMGVEVLRGADIGVPKNTLITMLRFRARLPSLDQLTAKWNAIAAALPRKSLPAGVRTICDRAEEFRAQYAPYHASLEDARERYIDYVRTTVS